MGKNSKWQIKSFLLREVLNSGQLSFRSLLGLNAEYFITIGSEILWYIKVKGY
jgi:hypothetical protein